MCQEFVDDFGFIFCCPIVCAANGRFAVLAGGAPLANFSSLTPLTCGTCLTRGTSLARKAVCTGGSCGGNFCVYVIFCGCIVCEPIAVSDNWRFGRFGEDFSFVIFCSVIHAPLWCFSVRTCGACLTAFASGTSLT